MFLPIVGLLIFAAICALVFIVGVFVLTYMQSKWGVGKQSWSLILFIIGALAGGAGTAVGIASLNGRYLYGIVNRFYGSFGPNMTKVGVVFAFLLAVTVGGILFGSLIVWLADRLILRVRQT